MIPSLRKQRSWQAISLALSLRFQIFHIRIVPYQGKNVSIFIKLNLKKNRKKTGIIEFTF